MKIPENSSVRAKLVEAFRRASAAAIAADAPDDGGTCNFDTPAFRIKGAQEGQLKSAAREAGVEIHRISERGYWAGFYWVWVPMSGQGNRRSRSMSAAQKVLDEYVGQIPGFEARGYYQMD